MVGSDERPQDPIANQLTSGKKREMSKSHRKFEEFWEDQVKMEQRRVQKLI